MTTKPQSIDPERLGNKEVSRGMHGSPWEGDIEQILQVDWGWWGQKQEQAGCGERCEEKGETGGIWRLVWKPRAVETS